MPSERLHTMRTTTTGAPAYIAVRCAAIPAQIR
jgi:hypothetical protein